MNQRLLAWVLGAIVTLTASPAMTLAQDEEKPNVRLHGYTEQVTIPPASTALVWLLLIGLGIICFGVLFKDSKRTHLD